MPEEEKSDKIPFKNFTREQKFVFCSIAFAYLSRFAADGLIAPNFPAEGGKHGVSSSVIGIVFSIGSLVSLIAAPIMGPVIATFGPKKIMISGISMYGTFIVLLGLCELLVSAEWFTTGSFICMGFTALGWTAISTAALTYAAHIFPTNMSFVVGATETFIGIGEAVGLASGGVLHDLGGYKLPLIVFGCIHLLGIPLNLFLLPTDDDAEFDSVGNNKVSGLEMEARKVSDEPKEIGSNILAESSDHSEVKETLFLKNGKKIPAKLRIWHLALIPATLIMAIMFVVTDVWWAFLESTLEPHLAPLKLTRTETNMMFLMMSVLWGFVCPVVGWLADRVERLWILMSLGLCGGGIGFCFLGPLPFLGLDNTVWQNIICLAIVTICQAPALIPACKAALAHTLEAGHRDNMATSAVVSSMISTMKGVGGIIGSFSGGFLVDNFGYPISAGICGGLCFSYGVFVASYFLLFHKGYPTLTRRGSSIRHVKEI